MPVHPALGTLYRTQVDLRELGEGIDRLSYKQICYELDRLCNDIADVLLQLPETTDWETVYLTIRHYGDMMESLSVDINRRITYFQGIESARERPCVIKYRRAAIAFASHVEEGQRFHEGLIEYVEQARRIANIVSLSD